MYFYEKFGYKIFCRKFNLEQMCHDQGWEKIFRTQFYVNKTKSMHFMTIFAKKFFVEN